MLLVVVVVFVAVDPLNNSCLNLAIALYPPNGEDKHFKDQHPGRNGCRRNSHQPDSFGGHQMAAGSPISAERFGSGFRSPDLA